jgi:hypothetical protein
MVVVGADKHVPGKETAEPRNVMIMQAMQGSCSSLGGKTSPPAPNAPSVLTILLHDDAGDYILEGLVEPC